MTSSRLWTLGSIVLIVALVAGAWLFGISPMLTAASTANDDRVAVQAKNVGLEVTLTELRKQFEDLETLKEHLAAVQVAIPDAAALPDLIRQLHARAAAHGVVITSITTVDPQPYVPVAEVASDPQLAAAADSVNSDNFLAIEIGLSVDGRYGDVMDFIADVQAGDRLYLIHDLILVEGSMQADAAVTLTTTGQVFVLLDPSQVPPPPAEPAPTAPVPAG
jgi:Tfp pilus assembly protein PilO